MDFVSALMYLRLGKKIRRDDWNKNRFIEMTNKIVDEEGKQYFFSLEDVFVNNWKEVKEKE